MSAIWVKDAKRDLVNLDKCNVIFCCQREKWPHVKNPLPDDVKKWLVGADSHLVRQFDNEADAKQFVETLHGQMGGIGG